MALLQRYQSCLCVAGRCYGGNSTEVSWLLTRTYANTWPECELRCSDPKAADVSCGGMFGAYTVYVLKGTQGECGSRKGPSGGCVADCKYRLPALTAICSLVLGVLPYCQSQGYVWLEQSWLPI
jgi:hypothetical protein